MPVLSRLPAPSPRGGGRSSAAVTGARSRRRSVGARGSSRAGRPRPEGGGPGSEGGVAMLCTCHGSSGKSRRRPLTEPSRARPTGTELSRRYSGTGSAGRTAREARQHARLLTRPAPAQPRSPPPSAAATARYAAPALEPKHRETFFIAPEWPAGHTAATPFLVES